MSSVGQTPRVREAGFFDESFQRKWTTETGVTLVSNGDIATITSTSQIVSGAGISRSVTVDLLTYPQMFTRARWKINPGQVDFILWTGGIGNTILASTDPVDVWKTRTATASISQITQVLIRFENSAFPVPKTSVAELDYVAFAKADVTAVELNMFEFERATERIVAIRPFPVGGLVGTEVDVQDRGARSPMVSMKCRVPLLDIPDLRALVRKYVYLEEFVHGGMVIMMKNLDEKKMQGNTRDVSISGLKAVNW